MHVDIKFINIICKVNISNFRSHTHRNSIQALMVWKDVLLVLPSAIIGNGHGGYSWFISRRFLIELVTCRRKGNGVMIMNNGLG